jgi:hypothetical protein
MMILPPGKVRLLRKVQIVVKPEPGEHPHRLRVVLCLLHSG